MLCQKELFLTLLLTVGRGIGQVVLWVASASRLLLLVQTAAPASEPFVEENTLGQQSVDPILTQVNSAEAILPKASLSQETAKEVTGGRRSALSTEIDAYLKAHYEIGWFSGSVMVVRAGEIVWSRGYGMASLEYQVPNSPQTRFRLGSVTKQFTAVAILQLQERGLLDVQAPVSTYLPDYPDGERITLHQLLTHTAGLPNLTSFPDYGEWMRLPMTLDELIARFKDLPLEFEPGEKYRYSNSGYILLTQVIETVSGQSYAEYLKEHLLHPLGMENTGYEHPLAVIEGLASGYQLTNEGYQRAEYINMLVPQGAGGLYSTVEDLARWNQFLFDDEVRDEKILKKGTIATMTSPLVPMELEDASHLFYGYGLVIGDQPERLIIGHGGGINGFMTNLIFFPDENLTIAVLCNVESANPERIARDLAAIVLGEPYEQPTLPEVVTVAPSVYERYVGTYQVTPEVQISITIEADQLQIQAKGEPALTLYPSSETEFFARVIDLRIVFNQGRDGTVESLTLLQNGQEILASKSD